MITRYILEQVSKVGTSKKHNAPWDCQDGLPRNGRRGALKGVFLDVNGAAIRPGSPMKCMGTVICPTASPLASSLRRPLFIPRPLSAPHRTEPDPDARGTSLDVQRRSAEKVHSKRSNFSTSSLIPLEPILGRVKDARRPTSTGSYTPCVTRPPSHTWSHRCQEGTGRTPCFSMAQKPPRRLTTFGRFRGVGRRGVGPRF